MSINGLIILHRPKHEGVFFVENLFATLKQMIKLTRLEQLIADRAVTTGGGQTPYFNSVEEVISYAPDDEVILLVADSYNQKLRLLDMN